MNSLVKKLQISIVLGAQILALLASAQAMNPYEVLGIQPTTDKEVITQAYRRLAMKYHPDRNKEPGAEERLKSINVAYDLAKKAAEKGQIHAGAKNQRREEPKSYAGTKSQRTEEPKHNADSMTAPELNAKIRGLLARNDSSYDIETLSLIEAFVMKDANWDAKTKIFGLAATYIEDVLAHYDEKSMDRQVANKIAQTLEAAAGPMYHFADSADFYDERELYLRLEARFLQIFILQHNLPTSQLIDILPRPAGGPPEFSISTYAYRFLATAALMRGEIRDYDSLITFEQEIRRIRGFGNQNPLLTDLHLFPEVAERIFATADTFEKVKLLSSRLGIGGAKLEVKRRLMEVAVEKKLLGQADQFISVLHYLIGDNPKNPDQSLRFELIPVFRDTEKSSQSWDGYFYGKGAWAKQMAWSQRMWLKNAPLSLIREYEVRGPLPHVERATVQAQMKQMSQKRYTTSSVYAAAGPSCHKVY